MQKLTIVIPAFNKEEVLPSSLERLMQIENQLIENKTISSNSDFLIVDDGSKDETWNIIQAAHQKNGRINGLKFSRNFGHQYALIAGMQAAIETADMIVSIDADLQDDPDSISEMVTKHLNGARYCVRHQEQS